MTRTPAQLLDRTRSGALDGGCFRPVSNAADRLEHGLEPSRLTSVLERRFGTLPNPAPLVRRGPSTRVLPSNITVTSRKAKYVPTLKKPRRFPVASIDLSRSDVGLPYGTPQHVNAATLKALAGGEPIDRLMRRTRLGWEFVPDDMMVDLADSSVEFKLGRLTIFS